jgi:hypothetical protein
VSRCKECFNEVFLTHAASRCDLPTAYTRLGLAPSLLKGSFFTTSTGVSDSPVLAETGGGRCMRRGWQQRRLCVLPGGGFPANKVGLPASARKPNSDMHALLDTHCRHRRTAAAPMFTKALPEKDAKADSPWHASPEASLEVPCRPPMPAGDSGHGRCPRKPPNLYDAALPPPPPPPALQARTDSKAA